MVGKILDKRYVVLEKVGPDGNGFRYLVYDMNTMARAHLRVDPDEDGQLSGKQFTVTSAETPLAPAAEPAGGGGAAESPDKPGPTQTTASVASPQTAPKPPAAVLKPLRPLSSVLKASIAPPPGLGKPADPVMPEPKKPRERVPTIENAAPPEGVVQQAPLDTTQRLDLSDAEELKPEIKPEPRKRIQTKVLEAAWFAQGDQFDDQFDDEADEEAVAAPVVGRAQLDPLIGQEQLERQARELSTDEYRKYSLELSPPVPPPVRVVEAFLGTKPDALLKSVERQALPVTQVDLVSPPPANPLAGASPQSPIARSSSAPQVGSAASPQPVAPSPTLPRSVPPPASGGFAWPPSPSAGRVAVPAVAPLPHPAAPVEPAPPRPAPPAIQPASPPPAIQPASPPPAFQPPSQPASPFAPTLIQAPTLLSVPEPSPPPTTAGPFGSPAPLSPPISSPAPTPFTFTASVSPEPKSPEPSPPSAPALLTLPTPSLPSDVMTSASPPPAMPATMAAPVTSKGFATLAPEDTSIALRRAVTGGRRVGSFLVGLVIGGAIVFLGFLAFGPRTRGTAKQADRPAVTCPDPPPVPKPQCPVCPKPPETAAKVAVADPPQPANPPQLTARDRQKVRALVAAGGRALKKKQWKKALRLTSEALRLEPGNPQASRIQTAASAKTH